MNPGHPSEIDTCFPYPSRRMPVLARNVIATSQPLAAQAGLAMLQQGGNAVDAGLAAAMALTVVEPVSNGIGSDAFAIYWDGAELHGLNASGRAPAAWTPEYFDGRPAMPEHGWDSVTVPGAVSAWAALSARFGHLPFETLCRPAIAYARDGYLVSPTVAESWRRAASVLKDQPGFAEAFLPQGRAPRAGELFRCGAMAESLEAIAGSRGEDFYHGDLARRMAAHARACGGALTEADLAAHQADWCCTLHVPYNAHALHEIPPNGQGIAALIALGLLAPWDIGRFALDGADSLHLQIEAMKLAFADVHRYVGDPVAMEIPADAMLDQGYLAARSRDIDLRRASRPQAGTPPRGDTVYLTAADADGRMLSYIQSNYMGFGSGVVVPGTGISLQNRGAGFTLVPGHANRVGPRKRPYHTIIPAFLMRGDAPAMSFGVMGGPMQPQGHVQMVLRVLDHGQNPQTAVDAPRWRVLDGRRVVVEDGFDLAVLDDLRARGHIIEQTTPDTAFAFGGAQLIWRLADGYCAGSDPRKDGLAAGY